MNYITRITYTYFIPSLEGITFAEDVMSSHILGQIELRAWCRARGAQYVEHETTRA